ncbi:Ribosomal RNA small subunit methyltransferase G [uncultured Gammaproteobacteria bacterium]
MKLEPETSTSEKGTVDGPECLSGVVSVSRETLDRLAIYAGLLRRWQPRLNLVGPATLDRLWQRHFLDSAQLFPLVPESAIRLVDLGSGAGFPALVLAILGVPEVHLVESDTRKAAFLREVAVATAAPVTVHPVRIEALGPLIADVVTARALAPLTRLLEYAQPLVGEHGLCLFPKGQSVEEELTVAQRNWNMHCDRVESITDPSARILRISNLVRRSGSRSGTPDHS